MSEHGHRHHHPQNHGHDHQVVFDTPEMATYAELEGEVLSELATRATAVVAEVAGHGGGAVRRVLDLGCGPGVGTVFLAERFPDAAVVAVDGSAVMLEFAAARAARLGLAGRITTRRADLPAGLADLGHADVVWASMFLHHVGDEADALRRVRGLLDPGGLLALVERVGPVRVLPTDDGARPGLFARLDTAWTEWFDAMRAELPGATESAAYPAMIAGAGFEVVVDDVLTLDLEPPLDERARRFAHGQLGRARAQLGEHADPADLAALDALLDDHAPESILHRADAVIRTARQLYVARAV